MTSQRGQSMAEFAAGAAVLSLLLLGATAICGYQEVDRRAVLASRQVAWQAAWSPGEDATARARAIHEGLFAEAGLRDPSGRQLLVREQDVAVSGGSRSPGGLAGAATAVLLQPLRVASGFLGGGFDLSERGMNHGMVTARIAPLHAMPAPFDSLDLELQVPYALLADAWHAGGVQHARSRAAGLVPSARLAALNAIWQPLSVPLEILEPSLGQLCFGLVEPDRIPEDRLGPGTTPLPGKCP